MWSIVKSTTSTGVESTENRDRVLWTGSLRSAPDLATLSTIIPSTVTEEEILYFTTQFLQNAPSNALSSLLNALACVYCRVNDTNLIDLSVLTNLSRSEKRSVCGRVFKKGVSHEYFCKLFLFFCNFIDDYRVTIAGYCLDLSELWQGPHMCSM